MKLIKQLWRLTYQTGRFVTTRPVHRTKRAWGLASQYAKYHGSWSTACQKAVPGGWELIRTEGWREFISQVYTMDISRKIAQLEQQLREEAHLARQAEKLAKKPLISLVVPVFRVKPGYLDRCIESVYKQNYRNWELILVDDGSQMRRLTRLMTDWSARDPRIRFISLEENVNISGATNVGIESAKGEYLAFLDHDDELTRDALFRVACRINEEPDADIIYSDSDKIDRRGHEYEPFHKPDWSPSYFHSVMYVGHLLVAKTQLVRDVGGCDSEFDGVQDFELMLRMSETAKQIEHIPRILYHWRVIPGSLAHDEAAKPRINELQKLAVQQHLDRQNIGGLAIRAKNGHRVRVLPKASLSQPKVSIMIPTRDRPELIGPCLKTIFEKTTYGNFEVLVGDNETRDDEALAIFAKYPIRRIDLPGGFHFAAFNNKLAREATGEYLLLLNNDTEIIQPDWLEQLVFHASQPGVGAVGPMLLYDDKSVQHAGVIIGPRGTADHVMRNFPSDSDGYAGSLQCTREVSAVTGACLLVSRASYEAAGGLNETFRRHYEDVDFCLKLSDRGLVNRYVGSVKLTHHESKTRGSYYDFTDRILLLDRWEHLIDRGDPYYNINFDPHAVDYSLRAA